MRSLPLVFVVLAGCGTSLPAEPTPVDVVGTWSADFLVNTTTASVGDDVSHFGDLTMKASTYQSSSDEHVGNVELKSVIYAAQGSIQNPKMDAQGKALAEAVGTALYAGTWSSKAYDGNTELTLSLNCESVDLTAMRPDLQAVCGAKGFDATVSASCTRPDGATTLNCRFGAGDIVFTRQ